MLKLLAVIAVLFTSPVVADSCWDHNGSLMRLKAKEDRRFFVYEIPREGLRSAGVTSGTVLFYGITVNARYQGSAHVFDNRCSPVALNYFVKGPVLQDPLRIEVSGRRQIYKNCQPTGRFTQDRLLFTYVRKC